MSIQAAKTFILTALDNKEFRSDISSCKTQAELDNALLEYEIFFSAHEFEEAFNNLHVACQTAEHADLLYNIKNWYQLVLLSFSE
ncbi:MAG: hypothetical protein ACOCWB_04250 [Bacteroidota bacterium]